MIITKRENVDRIVVDKEELIDSYSWKEPQEIKIYKYKNHPWYKFWKARETVYVDKVVTKVGFYSNYSDFRDEVSGDYYTKTQVENLYNTHTPSDCEVVKDNQLYFKPCVTFYIKGANSKSIYFDTYKEAVEHAKTFIKFGLDVIIGE